MFLLGLFASMMSTCATRMGPVPMRGTFETTSERPAARRASADLLESSATSGGYSDGLAVQLDRSPDGHFYADVEINGAPVHMLVDTGATGIALSRDDAHSAGLATSIGMNDVVGRGADGSVHGEFVTLERVRLGGTTATGLDAVVLNNGEQSLLGQEFLSKFASVEIHGNVMVLK
ncbi:MAG: TIGR02281 family clan AA aspartic protease [Sphingomicrobium sp.]